MWERVGLKEKLIKQQRKYKRKMYIFKRMKKHFLNEQRSRDAAAKKELIQVE